MREAILAGSAAFEAYVRNFLATLHPRGDIHQWVVDALRFAKIDVADMKLISDEILDSRKGDPQDQEGDNQECD